MAGRGTGWPLTLRCAKCKVGRDWRAGSTYDTELVRTGRTKPYNGGNRGRGLATFHEYRCVRCGHIGWSRHHDVVLKPLEQIRIATPAETQKILDDWRYKLTATTVHDREHPEMIRVQIKSDAEYMTLNEAQQLVDGLQRMIRDAPALWAQVRRPRLVK